VRTRAAHERTVLTCDSVDWRTTVVGELEAESHVSLNAATASLASALRIRVGELTMEHWGMFASQWRESYQKFTRRLAEDPTIPWKSVDDHHLESLRELVTKCVDGGICMPDKY
jgi:2-haloacid dehalogenase